MSVGRDAPQFVPRIGNGLERAVLRVWAAGLERHHECLAGGVHDAVGDLEAGAIQARENFHADADPRGRAGLAPRALGCRSRGDQCIGRRFRIPHTQPDAERRPLRADRLAGSGLVECKGLVEVRFERRFAVGVGAFPVHFGARHFDERAPVTAALEGGECVLQRGFVLREQWVGHGGSLMDVEGDGFD